MTASSSLERPPRKENKFVAFFRSSSHPRSRSRAKSNFTSEPQTLPTTSLENELGHSQHPGLVPTTTQPITKLPTSSRPISSTTTATHSTITPLPSESIRRRQRLTRHVYSHQYLAQDPDHQPNQDHPASHDHNHTPSHDDRHLPRSDTPSSLNRRRKLELFSIFGIGLSRKLSLSNSSRKPSPGNSDRKASASTLSQNDGDNNPAHKRSFKLNSEPSDTSKSIDESRVMKASTSALPIPSSPLPLSASPHRLSFGLTPSSRAHTPMTSSSHLPPTRPSRHGKRHSVGSHHTAHDSAVALPDDHSDSAVTSSSFLDRRSNSKPAPSTLHHIGKSRKGKEKECDFGSPKPCLPARKSSHSDFFRIGTFRSLPEETSPLVSISPLPQEDPHGVYDPGVLAVSVLPTALSAEDTPEQLPLICAPHARPAIPQIIHTPPTPQRAGEPDSPVRPATSPPRLSGGKGKPREVLLSQGPVAIHNELPTLHVRVTTDQEHREGDSGHNTRTRGRCSPRLFGSKDLPREKESKKQRAGMHDSSHSPGVVGPPRNITGRRIKHGSFDFERPVSSPNRSQSTAKGEGSTQCRKDAAATHHPTALEQTTSSSNHTAKLRTYAYHPARADSPILAQLSPNHTGETSVVSFSSASASASAQSKSTGKNSTPGPGQSSSWGHASGKRAQRTSHGLFAFEPAVSPPTSPLSTSSALPRSSPYPQRVEFGAPEETASVPTNSPLRSEFEFGGRFQRDKSYSTRNRGQQAREQKKFKGRSLDLNLGLSWAPNRVRQEAVMPGLLLSKTASRKQEEAWHHGKDVTKVLENVLSESSFEAFKKYVHRFDAHLIPLEGPRGLLTRVEKLLTTCPISQGEKAELLDQFARFVKGHGET